MIPGHQMPFLRIYIIYIYILENCARFARAFSSALRAFLEPVRHVSEPVRHVSLSCKAHEGSFVPVMTRFYFEWVAASQGVGFLSFSPAMACIYIYIHTLWQCNLYNNDFMQRCTESLQRILGSQKRLELGGD